MYYQTSPYQTQKMTPCVKGLIIANAVMFILQILPGVGNIVTALGAMIPKDTFIYGEIWRLFTYMFLHSPDMLFHIVFNMLALWWFGAELEDIWGCRKFLIFYLTCGAGAAVFSAIYLLLTPFVMIIGASGAVLGVLTAYAMFYPTRQVLLFFVIPMRIRTLVIGYAVFSVLFTLRDGSGVAHLTHLGGIAVAWIYLRVFPKIRIAVDRWIYMLKVKRRIKKF